MSDCIFCKITAGEFGHAKGGQGTEFVYEDEICCAFRDLHPKAKTHILIVPKKHIPSIAELGVDDQAIAGHLLNSAKIIGEKLNLPGYNLQINVGKEGGQEIFHLHLHLMSNAG
ncbi:MAG: HIT domain-containing protein [Patescibacteria group bacterium]